MMIQKRPSSAGRPMNTIRGKQSPAPVRTWHETNPAPKKVWQRRK